MIAFLFACTQPVDTTDTDDTHVHTTGTTSPTQPPPTLAESYDFVDRFGTESSVDHSGQILRQLLIRDLKAHVDGLTGRLDAGWFPVAGDVAAELDFYFSFDSETSGTVSHDFTSDPAPLQQVYDDVATGKNLVGKIAGNDPAGQHEDWSTALIGWPQAGVTTPESLVRVWFDEVDAAAVAWSNGDIPLDPSGAPVPGVHVSANGLNYQELIAKFLGGAVSFSQGTDDYLDDDLPGSGLLSPHAANEEGKPYSALEHAWDEAFGYYGAPRDWPTWAEETTASPSTADTWHADGAVDLLGEVAWGHSTNAAKRDLGAVAATDFTADAWAGFHEGRALLASIDGELTADELATLQGHRDRAVAAWEAGIGATVVHYINEVLVEMSEAGTADYSFGDHAKAWSEMKGFALALQFNPRCALDDSQLEELHVLIGTAPVLSTASSTAVDAYASDLREARALLGTAYGFDPANLGDDDGRGGW